jgi:hypothetical protein
MGSLIISLKLLESLHYEGFFFCKISGLAIRLRFISETIGELFLIFDQIYIRIVIL